MAAVPDILKEGFLVKKVRNGLPSLHTLKFVLISKLQLLRVLGS
jgi:hypothetical protein